MKTSIFAVFILIFLLGGSLSAQISYSGELRGVVRDENQAVIAGAQVIARNVGTKVQQTFTSNTEGAFSFANLPLGNYEVRILAEGFSIAARTVQVGETTTVDFTLIIGETRVTVTAEIGQAEEAINVPQAVNIIGSNDILQRATSVLAQIGEEEAGLNVQKTSPTIGAIVVRGLTGKNVVNYVDGVRYTTGTQRGGINTFFNLNEPSNFQSVEVLRGPNGAQYGSDSLGGTVNLLTRVPRFGVDESELHGEIVPTFSSADRSFGNSAYLSYGTQKLVGAANLAGRRINHLRTANGIDSHSAITRFLGLPSDVLYNRSPDTAFTQYGGSFRLNYAPRDDQQFAFYYQRSQQDGGKRFDQMLGGDGNLIADLRNLMLDFGYLRYVKQKFAGFDSASFTVSYNSQREERINQGGQGNPFGDITHQYERTTAAGLSFFLDKQLPANNSFLVGGDFYHEKVNSPAFIVNPVTKITTISRPRVPDEARFNSGGLFIQDAWQAIPERLRITGALRYSAVEYRSRAEDSPIVNNRRLWEDDSLRTGAFSGRIGAVFQLVDNFRVAFNYGRGFRYPSITDLGTLGLTGDGFEVDYNSAINLSGTIGTTADSNAISTGISVAKQRSEVSNNFDVGLRFQKKGFDTEFTVFRLDINDAITKQALILPLSANGQMLGGQIITVNAPIGGSGIVFVPASTSPVLVRANFTAAKLFGLEYEVEARLTHRLSFKGNFTYIHAEDKDTGLPPNIEGGTPPPTGFLSLRYDRSRYWVEAYSTMTAKQDRLSTLDLSDRRTGAPRIRAQIENYFKRGACVNGLTSNAAQTCNANVNTYTLLPTGENITQVLTRVLGPGFPASNLFTSLPSYALANLRGGFTINENANIFWAFENMFDTFHRNPSWGIDGAGRSFTLKFRYKF